jgi:hypothetical protein
MRQGQWKLTHQGIAFGTSGRLLDGQHRLAAIIDSQTSQYMLVFVDCPEDGFANFDRGAQRSVADVLAKDPRMVTIAATMVRLTIARGGERTRRAMPAEVQKVLETFAPDLEAMKNASVAERTGRTLAGIRAAWLVHHHGASDGDKLLLQQQWRAFADYDTRRMDESTASGDRRMERFKSMRGGALEAETLGIGWLMFDPVRRDLERIVIHNTGVPLEDYRASMQNILPELVVTTAEPYTPVARGRDAAMGVEKPVRVKRTYSPRWTPMADPVMGPALRAKAMEAIAARKGA